MKAHINSYFIPSISPTVFINQLWPKLFFFFLSDGMPLVSLVRCPGQESLWQWTRVAEIMVPMWDSCHTSVLFSDWEGGSEWGNLQRGIHLIPAVLQFQFQLPIIT